MNAIKKYQCSRCDHLHDDEWDAEECCKPEVRGVWICEHCDVPYDTADAAELCCSDEPETPQAYRARIQQLEAAGQQRLVP